MDSLTLICTFSMVLSRFCRLPKSVGSASGFATVSLMAHLIFCSLQVLGKCVFPGFFAHAACPPFPFSSPMRMCDQTLPLIWVMSSGQGLVVSRTPSRRSSGYSRLIACAMSPADEVVAESFAASYIDFQVLWLAVSTLFAPQLGTMVQWQCPSWNEPPKSAVS